MKIMSKSDQRKCFDREINLFENIIIELKKITYENNILS